MPDWNAPYLNALHIECPQRKGPYVRILRYRRKGETPICFWHRVVNLTEDVLANVTRNRHADVKVRSLYGIPYDPEAQSKDKDVNQQRRLWYTARHSKSHMRGVQAVCELADTLWPETEAGVNAH